MLRVAGLFSTHTDAVVMHVGCCVWDLGMQERERIKKAAEADRMKAEKTGTIIETTGGGITEVNGAFVFSNAGWNANEPAFLIEDSTVNLYGINERNFNRQPVSLWVRERQGAEMKELAELPWVYLSR